LHLERNRKMPIALLATVAAAAAAASMQHLPQIQHARTTLQSASPRMQVDAKRTFRRGKILDMWEEVPARDIVNVLGRWQTYQQWDSVGPLREMDKLFGPDWQPLKPLPVAMPSFFYTRRVSKQDGDYARQVKAFEASGKDFKAEGKSYGVGERNDPRPTPQRRGWAKRNQQVQRYWHNQNVQLLKFTSKPLAASVGATVQEMNQLPINPRATEIVFDALSRSQGGITEEATCDERRAAWQFADGSFNADAFDEDLWEARKTVASAYFLFPGLPFIVSNAVFYSPKVDGIKLIADYSEKNNAMLAKNAAMWADVFSK